MSIPLSFTIAQCLNILLQRNRSLRFLYVERSYNDLNIKQLSGSVYKTSAVFFKMQHLVSYSFSSIPDPFETVIENLQPNTSISQSLFSICVQTTDKNNPLPIYMQVLGRLNIAWFLIWLRLTRIFSSFLEYACGDLSPSAGVPKVYRPARFTWVWRVCQWWLSLYKLLVTN